MKRKRQNSENWNVTRKYSPQLRNNTKEHFIFYTSHLHNAICIYLCFSYDISSRGFFQRGPAARARPRAAVSETASPMIIWLFENVNGLDSLASGGKKIEKHIPCRTWLNGGRAERKVTLWEFFFIYIFNGVTLCNWHGRDNISDTQRKEIGIM